MELSCWELGSSSTVVIPSARASLSWWGNGGMARAAKGLRWSRLCQVWQSPRVWRGRLKTDQTISRSQSRSQPPAHATTKAANLDTRHLARRRRDAAHLILIIPIAASSLSHAATHLGVSPNLVSPSPPITTLTPLTECDCLAYRLLSSIFAISGTRNGGSGPSAAEFAPFRPPPVAEVPEHCRPIHLHPAPRDQDSPAYGTPFLRFATRY